MNGHILDPVPPSYPQTEGVGRKVPLKILASWLEINEDVIGQVFEHICWLRSDAMNNRTAAESNLVHVEFGSESINA